MGKKLALCQCKQSIKGEKYFIELGLIFLATLYMRHEQSQCKLCSGGFELRTAPVDKGV